MRESLELAYCCAYLNGDGTHPEFFHIDDIHFVRPVPVGATIRFVAHLSYVNGRVINVTVVVNNLVKELNNLASTKVFEFNINFITKSSLPEVVPTSYQEAVYYLEGKRRTDQLVKIE